MVVTGFEYWNANLAINKAFGAIYGTPRLLELVHTVSMVSSISRFSLTKSVFLYIYWL